MSKNILGYVFLLLGGRVLSTFSGFPSSLLKGVLPQRLENRNDSSAFKCHKLAYPDIPDTYRCRISFNKIQPGCNSYWSPARS